jgi:MFS family permease
VTEVRGVHRARTAVALAFVLNGFAFACLVTRFPDVRRTLALSNGDLGLVLLGLSAGSVLALPASGRLIERWSAAAVVRGGAVLVALGLLAAAVGTVALGSVPVVTLGLFAYGVGTGLWDVSMNVEGAAVEHELGRAIMPRFHAGWSMGSIAGAAIGVPVSALGVAMPLHLGVVGLVGLVVVGVATRDFLPSAPAPEPGTRGRSAWREPRTLAVGLMVLAFALTEGTANDWLALALIDGYDTPPWVGVAGYALFVTAMTTGRLAGTHLLDRFGRVPVLRATGGAAFVGVLLVVLGGHPVLAAVGIVVWGLGASLGFPVGMSAAADDPARSAARVSVVSTIGYAAFLAGPPLLGFVGDQVGTLRALLVVAVLLVPSLFVVGVAREPARRG